MLWNVDSSVHSILACLLKQKNAKIDQYANKILRCLHVLWKQYKKRYYSEVVHVVICICIRLYNYYNNMVINNTRRLHNFRHAQSVSFESSPGGSVGRAKGGKAPYPRRIFLTKRTLHVMGGEWNSSSFVSLSRQMLRVCSCGRTYDGDTCST